MHKRAIICWHWYASRYSTYSIITCFYAYVPWNWCELLVIFADRNQKKPPGSRRLGFECRGPRRFWGSVVCKRNTALRPWQEYHGKAATDFFVEYYSMIWFQKGLLFHDLLLAVSNLNYTANYVSIHINHWKPFLSHFQSILHVTHTQSPQMRGLGRDRLDVNLWEMCWMPLL